MNKNKSAISDDDILSDESMNGCRIVDDSSSNDVQVLDAGESSNDCLPTNFINKLQVKFNYLIISIINFLLQIFFYIYQGLV